MPTALVTGGEGFIGSHVCESLLAGDVDAGRFDDTRTDQQTDSEPSTDDR